jgi:hypothetical protein
MREDLAAQERGGAKFRGGIEGEKVQSGSAAAGSQMIKTVPGSGF